MNNYILYKKTNEINFKNKKNIININKNKIIICILNMSNNEEFNKKILSEINNYNIIITGNVYKFNYLNNITFIKTTDNVNNYSILLKYLDKNRNNYSSDDILYIVNSIEYINKEVLKKINDIFSKDIWIISFNNINIQINLFIFRFGLINYIDKELYQNNYISNEYNYNLHSNLINICYDKNIYNYDFLDDFFCIKKLNNNINKIILNNKLRTKISYLDMCVSDEQKDFNKFLNNNNIKQIYISNGLNKFNRIKKIYNLSEYYDGNKPSLFFGAYHPNDINILMNHKEKIYLIFGGTDCNHLINYHKKNVNIIKKNKNIVYLSISENIKYRLKTFFNIESIFINFDLLDYNIFTKSDKLINSNKIYIYDGNNKSNPIIYNLKICNEIENELKEKFIIIRSSKMKTINYEDMGFFYKQFFIGLRLTDNDGNANTVQEFEALDIPIVHNQSAYGLKWRNKNDIITHIYNNYNL